MVAALAAEARTLGSPVRREGLSSRADGTLIAVSGIGGAAAGTAARALVQAGATALVSWGMAGGLDPALRAGTICLPSTVVSAEGETMATDTRWCATLAASLSARRRRTVVAGRLLTSAAAIADIPGKAAAFRRFGAAAVDMESLDVAKIAAIHGLPFIAVRVIVDTAADVLPAVVLAASSAGRVQASRLLLGVVRSPRAVAPLWRLARRYRAAVRALVAVAGTGALAPLADAAAGPARLA